MSLHETPIWDQESLVTRMRGKTDRVIKLVNLFLGDMPDRMEALKQEVADSELEALGATAHTVKGVAANLGILRLQQAAADIELAAKNEQRDGLEQLLADINAVYEESESQLRAYIDANSLD